MTAPDERAVASEPALNPALRTARRHETFARQLQVDPVPLPSSTSDEELPNLVALDGMDLPPVEAVALLYLLILGRTADPSGLETWTGRLEQGERLLDLAQEMAESPEALCQTPTHRTQVLVGLADWARLAALTELGVTAPWQPDAALRPGITGHQIFVRALWEVAFQRRPTTEETEADLARLVRGDGREALLRTYAASPEWRNRLFGTARKGIRARVRRQLDTRHALDTFRACVLAAENRQVVQLCASLPAAATFLRLQASHLHAPSDL